MASSYKKYEESDAVKAAKAKAEANSTYKASDSVKLAQANLANHEVTKPVDWTGGEYGESLKGAIDKINNRQPFTYDLNGDALYQQYKNQYIQGGKLAMMDTLGQASALTGGYGNSYATTAGNQAYQGYLTKLNEVVPDLYKMAYDKYNNEMNDMYNQASLYNTMYNKEYGQYRDNMSDWQNERSRLQDVYDTEAERDYKRFADNRDYFYDAYNRALNDYKTEVSAKIGSSGASGSSLKAPTREMLEEAMKVYSEQGEKGLQGFIDLYPEYDQDYMAQYAVAYGVTPVDMTLADQDAKGGGANIVNPNYNNPLYKDTGEVKYDPWSGTFIPIIDYDTSNITGSPLTEAEIKQGYWVDKRGVKHKPTGLSQR